MRAGNNIDNARVCVSSSIVVAEFNLARGSDFIPGIQRFIMLAKFRQGKCVLKICLKGRVAHIGSDGSLNLIFGLDQLDLQSMKLSLSVVCRFSSVFEMGDDNARKRRR